MLMKKVNQDNNFFLDKVEITYFRFLRLVLKLKCRLYFKIHHNCFKPVKYYYY